VIKAHGKTLKNLMIDDSSERVRLIDEPKPLTRIKLSTLEFSDLIMLGIGAFSPLEGFMDSSDYSSVLDSMRLSDGTLWPLPVTITVDNTYNYSIGERAALISPYSDDIVGQIEIEDIYKYDKEKEAKSSFGTNDLSHPGLAKLKDAGSYHLGGKVAVLTEGGYPEAFPRIP